MKLNLSVFWMSRQDNDDVIGPDYVDLGCTSRTMTCAEMMDFFIGSSDIRDSMSGEFLRIVKDENDVMAHGECIGYTNHRIGDDVNSTFLFTTPDQVDWMAKWLSKNDVRFHPASQRA